MSASIMQNLHTPTNVQKAHFALLVEREVLAADYARAIRLGQRIRARDLHERMRGVVCIILSRKS